MSMPVMLAWGHNAMDPKIVVYNKRNPQIFQLFGNPYTFFVDVLNADSDKFFGKPRIYTAFHGNSQGPFASVGYRRGIDTNDQLNDPLMNVPVENVHASMKKLAERVGSVFEGTSISGALQIYDPTKEQLETLLSFTPPVNSDIQVLLDMNPEYFSKTIEPLLLSRGLDIDRRIL